MCQMAFWMSECGLETLFCDIGPLYIYPNSVTSDSYFFCYPDLFKAGGFCSRGRQLVNSSQHSRFFVSIT